MQWLYILLYAYQYLCLTIMHDLFVCIYSNELLFMCIHNNAWLFMLKVCNKTDNYIFLHGTFKNGVKKWLKMSIIEVGLYFLLEI